MPQAADKSRNIEITNGLRAGLALLAVRPRDVVKVAFSRQAAREIEPLTRPLRARGVPCAMLPDAELDRLARAPQHEGVYIEARPRAWTSPEDAGKRLVASRGVGVALDHVQNPYNAGAILRTAAFFGAGALLLGVPADREALGAQAVRVAEGGAEYVPLSRTPHLADALGALRKLGVLVVGADGGAKRDWDAEPLSYPMVVVVGHERQGLHERVRAQCDALVAVRGTGAVESLNVAVAAGVLLARAARGRP